MIEIYNKIAELRSKFKKMCYGITKNETEIDDAVQELMLYFLSMNQQTLSNIFKKDGEEGLVRYGAVVLRRALTSPRSPFYYKYKKYYTHINSIYQTNTTLTHKEIGKALENVPEIKVDNWHVEKLDDIDEVLSKLYWYDRKIFELYYYEDNTLDSLAKLTKISRNSLFTTIDKVREILKKELIDE
tara:strand:- start:607 stop:1164 length:558 start_codon:yes stop_codon:yes gene_type:complete